MKALFASRSRQAWLLGPRTLCWPLTWLGLDINRAALRLWLTLEESERLTGQAPPRWRDLWQTLSAAPTAAPEHAQGDEGRALTLQLQALTARDLLAWLVLALALAASVSDSTVTHENCIRRRIRRTRVFRLANPAQGQHRARCAGARSGGDCRRAGALPCRQAHRRWRARHRPGGASGLRCARPPGAWVRGVNSHLPPGVAVCWAQPVPEHFHSRFSAYARCYRYVLLNRPVRPAIAAGQVGWFHAPLEVEAMREASAHLLGQHDFPAFAPPNARPRPR